MIKLRNKVLAAISAGTLLLGVVAPVAADTTLQITGNASDTTNSVSLTQASTTTVSQSNSANVTNHVDAHADSGNNDASRNTGGAVTVDTGNAKTDVSVSNTLNSNSANVDCNCASNDASVLISGNADGSTNDAALTLGNSTTLFQDNNAHVRNDVDAKSDTGHNDANRNTGGNVKVTTGDATSTTDVNTTANANWAKVGNGSQGNGSIDLRIVSNGSDTTNSIALVDEPATVLSQSNNARVSNDVDSKAETGDNDANRNAGGNVTIDTGNAKSTVDVDNLVNFNWADIDCGCLSDIFAKVGQNGDSSDNSISAALAGEQSVFQDNCGEELPTVGLLDVYTHHDGCKLNNDLGSKAKTGDNDAKSNTGSVSNDPSIYTGNADSSADVSNSGNSNAYGVAADSEMPSVDFNFNLSLDWNQLLALLGQLH